MLPPRLAEEALVAAGFEYFPTRVRILARVHARFTDTDAPRCELLTRGAPATAQTPTYITRVTAHEERTWTRGRVASGSSRRAAGGRNEKQGSGRDRIDTESKRYGMTGVHPGCRRGTVDRNRYSSWLANRESRVAPDSQPRSPRPQRQPRRWSLRANTSLALRKSTPPAGPHTRTHTHTHIRTHANPSLTYGTRPDTQTFRVRSVPLSVHLLRNQAYRRVHHTIIPPARVLRGMVLPLTCRRRTRTRGCGRARRAGSGASRGRRREQPRCRAAGCKGGSGGTPGGAGRRRALGRGQ